ncbi:hypothetical protein IFR05_003210 [Cadophora sp. M221]|nr:hypothetical protein IFR05_003210 [Cadophora sp. M221]
MNRHARLGAQVRTFVNDSDPYNGGQDMTQRAETERTLLIEAAKSMKFLSKASFNSNPLGIHVVTTLPSYPELYDLTLDGFILSKHIWGHSLTALKSLTWKMRRYDRAFGASFLTEAYFLLKVVEATCPDLEVLNISLNDHNYREVINTDSALSLELIGGYNSLPDSTYPKLINLRHFGLHPRDFRGGNSQAEIKSFILDIARRYDQSLKSISIPAGSRRWTRDWLDFVLEVCALIPDLRELDLTRTSQGSGSKLTQLEAFYELTTSPATSKVERFSSIDIQGHFSGEIGLLFKAWKNLKFLQVGDENNSGGPFEGDGRLQFDSYRLVSTKPFQASSILAYNYKHILAFIQALPQSLQQIYLEINGEGLWCDEPEDFDPVSNMGNAIFCSLHRLHVCDIHAWISNCDGGLSWLPEKGVFYRRLPGDDAQRPKKKSIWTSRTDMIYRDGDILVKKDVELAEGDAFEGEDAREVWLDGATFQKSRFGGTSRGRPANRPDSSWPFCLDLMQTRIENYEMWRERR